MRLSPRTRWPKRPVSPTANHAACILARFCVLNNGRPSAMGLSQITLTDYDAVVAVTQNALNETLATYLSQLKKQVGLFFNVDSGGNYVAAPDPATADYSFTG